jgi:CheY-like chemotaxis protein
VGPAAGSQPAPEQAIRSLRILCIDDEPKMRQLLTDCLTDLSHRVTVAESGKRGVELVHAARLKNEPYEVVITDLGMPDLDGHDVARAIKTDSPGTSVIMMTGWANVMKTNGESSPEVDALLPKPPNIQNLQELLLRFGAKKQSFNAVPA